MKAVIIKDLKKLEDVLVKALVLIPKPKQINRFERNNAFILTSESTICFSDVENEKVLLEDLNEILNEIT